MKNLYVKFPISGSVENDNFTNIQSQTMEKFLDKMYDLAETSDNIIIVGEYGSGKKRCARAIHQRSNRENTPFTHVNCNIIDEDHALVEFFGHIAFTNNGAKIKKAAFEKANNGTLYLEHFGTLSQDIQKVVLKAIAEKRFTRIGGQNKIPINVRLILGFGKDSYNELREDDDEWQMLVTLFNPKILKQPPLRKRRDDIPGLIQAFIKDLKQKYNWQILGISPRALMLLISNSWTGNIKELKNTIQHAALFARGTYIQTHHLPSSVNKNYPQGQEAIELQQNQSYLNAEKSVLKKVLKKSNNIEDAANQLEMSRKTLKNKLGKYQFEEDLLHES